MIIRDFDLVGITTLPAETHSRQADGSVLSRWTGAAFVYAGGTTTIDDVVFGEPGGLVLLGARWLEGLNRGSARRALTPVPRTTMLVRHGKDLQNVFPQAVHNVVWKSRDDESSDAFGP